MEALQASSPTKMIIQGKPSLIPFSMAKKAYEKQEEEEEDHETDEDWLQLSIGEKTTNSCFSVQSLCSLRSKRHPSMHGLKLSEQVAWRVWNSTTTCSTSTSSSFMQYDHQSFPVNMMKVVTPPQRPPAGVWFSLKAAKNHGRQPSLPQINKSYLRIKDSSMRIRLLLKYLASKLELGLESEVEITCRGQGLHPYFTLKHVRDNIWCQREAMSTPTKDHLMTLKYHRRI